MKKYVTLAALLAAGTTFANAESLTLPENTDYTWVAGSNASGIGTGATAEIVQKLATAIGDDLTGWFAGTGQAYDANSQYKSDISIISDSSFSFKCRPALSGEYVALGVTLTEAADSITISFETSNKLGYSLWSYDGTTATELVGLTYQGAAGSVSQTYDFAEIAADSQIFAIWTANHPTGNVGGGQTVTVSNIALTYTAAVPEPSAFGMLAGLGALALVASRRRRK
ncbi:MAG: PEP-CTERM sorting domain-containing protein [Opitutales bacterium]|nr:PEP-CTERM sorting domain-containing protein [Opitutales bacterium]